MNLLARFIATLCLLLALIPVIGCAQDDQPPSRSAAFQTPTSSSATSPSQPDSVYAAALKEHINQNPPVYLREQDRIGEAVQRFYERRDFQPAWSSDARLHDHARTLVNVLRQADREGLTPAYYRLNAIQNHLDAVSGPGTSPEAVAELDALLSFAFMDYASDLYSGRISPEDVDPEWYTELTQKDYAEVLQTALNASTVEPTLNDLAPSHTGYQRLREALQTYRELAEQDGWPEIPDGEVLNPSDSSARVPPLRERLAVMGYLDETRDEARDHHYDERLAGAVYDFQERHGLTTDSLLGPNTVSALNIPIEDRIEQIELNMERWRWLPDDLGDRYVLVNIPAFRVYAYDGGQVAEAMDVVVGKAYAGRQTPVFTDEMEHLIFSPFWNIPPSIANNEILPEARGNRDYLVANDYEVVSHYGPGAEVYDTYSVDLGRVESGDLRLRQKPGPENALGLVKFMFPNSLNIYLHDTPADHLFDRTERDYSHGCIRVERPVDLAVYALSGNPDWDRQRIEQAMHNGEWQKVELSEHIPVYILYFTALASEGNPVRFYADLYGHDAELAEQL